MGQGEKNYNLRIHQVVGLSSQVGLVPFVEMKNRRGRIGLRVDKDLKFTLGNVKFEVGQENTHVLKQLGFLSLKLKKEYFAGLRVIGM